MMSITNAKHFGPFEVLEKLGRGGMASVFKARYSCAEPRQEKTMEHLEENEVVALKIANWVVVSEPLLALRFYNEYEITRHLLHPNLVRARGYGVENELP